MRIATLEDAPYVRRVVELDSARPMSGRLLIGEIDGAVAAVMSLDDGRVAADPFQRTSSLVVHMRSRAQATHAYERTPSLRERLLAGVRIPARSAAA
ncbi:MAG TPA: hypothetical protein VF549_21140 [Solirubrobacteraceae bacterium]